MASLGHKQPLSEVNFWSPPMRTQHRSLSDHFKYKSGCFSAQNPSMASYAIRWRGCVLTEPSRPRSHCAAGSTHSSAPWLTHPSHCPPLSLGDIRHVPILRLPPWLVPFWNILPHMAPSLTSFKFFLKCPLWGSDWVCPSSYVGVLTSNTTECDLPWKQYCCRCQQLRWGP